MVRLFFLTICSRNLGGSGVVGPIPDLSGWSRITGLYHSFSFPSLRPPFPFPSFHFLFPFPFLPLSLLFPLSFLPFRFVFPLSFPFLSFPFLFNASGPCSSLSFPSLFLSFPFRFFPFLPFRVLPFPSLSFPFSSLPFLLSLLSLILFLSFSHFPYGIPYLIETSREMIVSLGL